MRIILIEYAKDSNVSVIRAPIIDFFLMESEREVRGDFSHFVAKSRVCRDDL